MAAIISRRIRTLRISTRIPGPFSAASTFSLAFFLLALAFIHSSFAFCQERLVPFLSGLFPLDRRGLESRPSRQLTHSDI
jgi:hypothetical protein